MKVWKSQIIPSQNPFWYTNLYKSYGHWWLWRAAPRIRSQKMTDVSPSGQGNILLSAVLVIYTTKNNCKKNPFPDFASIWDIKQQQIWRTVDSLYSEWCPQRLTIRESTAAKKPSSRYSGKTMSERIQLSLLSFLQYFLYMYILWDICIYRNGAETSTSYWHLFQNAVRPFFFSA